MHKQKYMLNSYENFLANRSNQHSIRGGMGGALGNRADAVKQLKKFKHKWNKELKTIKKAK